MLDTVAGTIIASTALTIGHALVAAFTISLTTA